MLVLESQLTKAQNLIYGRKRIVDSFYQLDPDKFRGLTPTDINSISLQGDEVVCEVDGSQLSLGRRHVLKNFLEHRTRTPSFFDYKVWNQYKIKDSDNGIPVAALDYSGDQTHAALAPHIGRPPKILTDKNGEQKIYFIKTKEQQCSCPSWAQLNEHKEELSAEFSQFTGTEFVPVCKHMQWHNSSLQLEYLRFTVQEQSRKRGYNLHMCVYHFDYRLGRLLYRVTNDGLKDKMEWLPKDHWKEQAVYDAAHTPTGNCWKVFTKALSHDPAYQLIQYSQSVAHIMGQINARNSTH